MKHLIYLNKESLYSYYAQAFDGIDESHQKGTTDANVQAEQHISETVSRNMEFKASLPSIVSFGAGKGVTEENINTAFYNLEAGRDYANIVLHDNALNRVIEHSKPNINADAAIGEYVIEKGHFSILDMQYLEDLSAPIIANFIAEQSWDEYVKKLPDPNAKGVLNGKKTHIANERNTINTANERIRAIKAMAMFDILLIVNGKLVPLKKQCMKESTKEIVFKYESEVSVFGKVTRKNQAMLNNSMGLIGNLNNSYMKMWFALLETLQLKADQNYTVIDPIAIYVE